MDALSDIRKISLGDLGKMMITLKDLIQAMSDERIRDERAREEHED